MPPPENLSLFLETKWNEPAKCEEAYGQTVGEHIDGYHLENPDDGEED
jgi:hypothetical protein